MSVVDLVVDAESMIPVRSQCAAEIQKQFDQIKEGYDLVFACDASYKDGVASIGITDGCQRWHFRLDNYLGHILAELIAILQALRLALTPEFEYPRKLLIATDCRSILTGLESAKKNNKVSQSSVAIDFGLSWFYEPCEVMLLWVPGHKGLSLNVVADENARIARELPEGSDNIFPVALRSSKTRWHRRETCDLTDCQDGTDLARHRDADQLLLEMKLKQSFLNADQSNLPDPAFAMCELCRDPGMPRQLQTFAHIFFECEALEFERRQMKSEFCTFGLSFQSHIVLDGYCIDATATFLDAVKRMKSLYVA